MSYEYMMGLGDLTEFLTASGLVSSELIAELKDESTTTSGRAGFFRPRERMQEIREQIREQACSGIGCPEGTEREAIRPDYSDPTAALAVESEMRERGCTVQCMEDGISWYCCPQAIQQMTLMMPTELQITPQETEAPPAQVAPVEQPAGFPWGVVAVLGILGIGIGGAVWYWKTR